MEFNEPSFPYESLPDDVVLLKEIIREQAALISIYIIESQCNKVEIKFLRKENRKLIQLLCPAN